MARYLSESDVRGLLTMDLALESVEAALRAHASGDAIDTPRVRTHTLQGVLHVMQAASPALDLSGFKYYYISRESRRSYVHLLGARSGRLEAIVESGWMGMMRTGAASGIAARHLARPDCRILGQIGAGVQGEGQLQAVCAVHAISQVRVFARDRLRLERFCNTMSHRLGIEVTPVESARQAVHGADIVNLITNSGTPVLEGAWLEPGQHLNAAGSNALSRRELDEPAVERCDVVAVDSRGTARRECGDLLPAIDKGLLRWEQLPELGELIIGRRAGRTSPRELTLYESHGMAVQDLYVAQRVLALARERSVGTRLPIG